MRAFVATCVRLTGIAVENSALSNSVKYSAIARAWQDLSGAGSKLRLQQAFKPSVGFSSVAAGRARWQQLVHLARKVDSFQAQRKAVSRLLSTSTLAPSMELLGRLYTPLGYALRLSALVVGGMNAAGFLVTAITKTHKVTDATGVGAFVASAWATHAAGCRLRGVGLLAPSKSLLLAGCVTLWGARLGGHLLSRVLAVGEDRRLRPFFPRQGEPLLRGPSIFPLKLAFFWTLQAAWAWVCLLPVTASQALAHGLPQSRMPTIIFGGLFLAALVIEGVADAQKTTFKSLNENKDRFMSTGLYQFSRHPNYFGEIMVWVALYGLAAYPRIWRVHPWVALSPLFTAFLLLKVSGVPNLEALHDRRYGKDADYQAWKASTSALIPWFPRGPKSPAD